jgi:hypothetical protein
MTPNRDAATGLFPVEALTPAVLSATQSSAVLDMIDFQSATVLLHIGIGGIAFSANNKIEVSLSVGDLADGSDAVPVTDLDIVKDGLAPAAIANGIVRSIVAPKAAADIQRIGYIGGKRYLKVTVTFSGAHATGTPIAASIAKMRATLKGVA